MWIETLSPSHEVAFKSHQKASRWLFYVMQKSKLRLVAWLFSHEVHEVSYTKQIKRNFHNSIKMKYNLDVMSRHVLSCFVLSCHVVLCYVVTSSLADIQALVFLLIHSQNVNWITRAQINPRREKMQISFYINQFHLWNNSMFLETIWFFFFFILCTFLYLYIYFLLFVNCFMASRPG